MSHKQWQKQIQYTIPLVTHSAKKEGKKGTTGNFSDKRETSQNRHNCTLEKNEITRRNPIN